MGIIDVVRGEAKRLRDAPPFVTSYGFFNSATLKWSSDSTQIVFTAYIVGSEEPTLGIFVTDRQ